MENHDYVLNEINKLARIIARLFGLKSADDQVGFSQLFKQTLQQEYDTDVEKLVALPTAEFITDLAATNYTAEKLNALSQLLYLSAQPFKGDEDTRALLTKVMAIFSLLEKKFAYESFDNLEKKKTIFQYLKAHES